VQSDADLHCRVKLLVAGEFGSLELESGCALASNVDGDTLVSNDSRVELLPSEHDD